MARFTSYWCKFPRESLPFTRRDNLLRALFTTLCCWAKPIGIEDPKILEGQVLTCDEELAGEHAVTRKTIARKLGILVKHGLIELGRDGRRGRVISVIHLCPHLVTQVVPNVSQTCPDFSPSHPLVPHGVEEKLVRNVSRLCPEYDPYSRELRMENGEGGGEPPYPPKISQLKKKEEGGGIINPIAPPIGPIATPLVLITKPIEREPMAIQDASEVELSPFLVWAMFTDERLGIRGIEYSPPRSYELSYAQTLINELKTLEKIRDRARKYLTWDKPYYVERAWPIKLLADDHVEIGARKDTFKEKENLKIARSKNEEMTKRIEKMEIDRIKKEINK